MGEAFLQVDLSLGSIDHYFTLLLQADEEEEDEEVRAEKKVVS